MHQEENRTARWISALSRKVVLPTALTLTANATAQSSNSTNAQVLQELLTEVRQLRMALEELAGRSQADDARTDHDEIGLAICHRVIMRLW